MSSKGETQLNSGAQTRMFRENKVNSMETDALAPRFADSPAAMVSTIWKKAYGHLPENLHKKSYRITT